ncbi:MAG TPA: hypothetical protein VI933_03275 [archaeon]|nr:hypothetical protein [archaeon]
MKPKGKLISLLSGGIDSPVASAMMKNLGWKIIGAHFFNYTSAREGVREKVIELAKKIPCEKIYLIPFRELQMEIVKLVPSNVRMILYRRSMFRIAGEILKKEKAKGFLTGDCLAQVASQTLQNMFVINEAAAGKKVFRPLVGFDKEEITKLAKEFGTYEISIKPYPDCCNFLVGEYPETNANLNYVKGLEEGVKSLEELERKALAGAEILKF